MLYNGNGFGETGFGYAVMTEDDRARRDDVAATTEFNVGQERSGS